MRFANWLRSSGALLALAAVFVAGCGDDNPLETYKAKGTVKIQGVEKIPPGMLLTFIPEKGDHSPTANVAEDGSFVVQTYEDGDGAPAGKYTIIASMSGTVDVTPPDMPPDDSGQPPVMPNIGPGLNTPYAMKYTSPDQSDLKVEVKTDESDNVFDLQLAPSMGGPMPGP